MTLGSIAKAARKRKRGEDIATPQPLARPRGAPKRIPLGATPERQGVSIASRAVSPVDLSTAVPLASVRAETPTHVKVRRQRDGPSTPTPAIQATQRDVLTLPPEAIVVPPLIWPKTPANRCETLATGSQTPATGSGARGVPSSSENIDHVKAARVHAIETARFRMVHIPLFNYTVEGLETELPAAIHFIVFCKLFADFLGWRSLETQFMESELKNPQSVYIIDLIIKLLQKLGFGQRTTLSSWQFVFKHQLLQRRSQLSWPSDQNFTDLDFKYRLRLLCELCDWVLDANKKQAPQLIVQSRMLPLAVEFVPAQQKIYVYWHFAVGGLRSRIYCQVLPGNSDIPVTDDATPRAETSTGSPALPAGPVPSEDYFVVASTASSWKSFLHRALSSNVPAHQNIRSGFSAIRQMSQLTPGFYDPPIPEFPRLPVETILQDLKAEEARGQEEERRAHEAQMARDEERRARLEKQRLERKLSAMQANDRSNSGSPGEETEIEATAALGLRNGKQFRSGEGRESPVAEVPSGDALHESEMDGVGGSESEPDAALQRTAEETAAHRHEIRKEEDRRLRRAMTYHLWALHRDVEQHALKMLPLSASRVGIPRWQCLSNVLLDAPSGEEGPPEPRLWLRNIYGVVFAEQLLIREMDMITKNVCKHIVDGLKRHPSHEPFFEPIDPEQTPKYSELIPHPMDIRTIYVNLVLHNYPNFRAFVEDVFLIFRNCRSFNKIKAPVVKTCMELELRFLEICKHLGVAVGHSGEGLNRPDPLEAWGREGKKQKTSRKKTTIEEPVETITIQGAPNGNSTVKRKRGRPRKSAATVPSEMGLPLIQKPQLHLFRLDDTAEAGPLSTPIPNSPSALPPAPASSSPTSPIPMPSVPGSTIRTTSDFARELQRLAMLTENARTSEGKRTVPSIKELDLLENNHHPHLSPAYQLEVHQHHHQQQQPQAASVSPTPPGESAFANFVNGDPWMAWNPVEPQGLAQEQQAQIQHPPQRTGALD
ncbi:hypothetical protein HKX48_003833 [Thoreauomyces humboldtii]|nr:hypothetical protein HKX48_003833 [Thoreauomyces humboldtii]